MQRSLQGLGTNAPTNVQGSHSGIVEQKVRILMIFLKFMYFSAFFHLPFFSFKKKLVLFKVDLVIKLNSILDILSNQFTDILET